MDLDINSTELVTQIASSTNHMLGQISPVLYLLGGMFLAFFVAYEILDTVAFNRTMRKARETREEANRLLDG